MTREIAVSAPDGTIDAHILTPSGPGGAGEARPAVILLTDIGGVRPSYFEKAQAIADLGVAVIMPNIYYRDVSGRALPEGKTARDPDIRPTILSYAAKLTPDAQARDFQALLGAIDAEPEFAAGPVAGSAAAPVAAIGYCLTGPFVLRLAALHPDRVVAVAGFHSARLAPADDPDSVALLADKIRARVHLGHADRDELLPPDQIARIDAALAAASVHVTTELHRGASHGFTSSDSPAWNPDAYALHLRRIQTLLSETLLAA